MLLCNIDDSHKDSLNNLTHSKIHPPKRSRKGSASSLLKELPTPFMQLVHLNQGTTTT